VTPTVIALLMFGTAAIAVVALAMLVRDLRRPDEDLERRLGIDLASHQDLLARSAFGQKRQGGRIDHAFERLVEDSGSPLDNQTALALVAGMAIVGCAVPLVLLESFLAAAAGTMVGAMLPILWWAIRRERRLRSMQRGLPETLDMLADGIRAGQTLEQATELVSQQGISPLKEEFGYCTMQLRLGHSPVAVLARMARRVPLAEFKIFATAVLVHRQTGGNLALLAQRLAASARDRAEFHGHVRAVTAGSRLSVLGLTVGTMVALLVLAGIRPEYLRAFVEHPIGPTLLMLSALLMVLGLLWVWRIIKVPF
jgi:tight adherence protein B